MPCLRNKDRRFAIELILDSKCRIEVDISTNVFAITTAMVGPGVVLLHLCLVVLWDLLWK